MSAISYQPSACGVRFPSALSALVSGLFIVALAACAPPPLSAPTFVEMELPPTAAPTFLFAIDTPTPTSPPAQIAALATQPPLFITPTSPPFQALQASLNQYAASRDFLIGVAVFDVQTGESASISGELRFFSLSTFKGPLAAYYLWLLDRGDISEAPGDEAWIEAMLGVSDNAATTCVFNRVGGIRGFNDWLASWGLSRADNFVYVWNSYNCPDDGRAPENDWRYRDGDAALGLPGDRVLLRCPANGPECDKGFAPADLAAFYARLARGEVLPTDALQRWLGWIEKEPEDSALIRELPPGVARAYVKDGFAARGGDFDMNYQHEAGIISLGQRTLAVAVFTQGNPEWPGEDVLADIMLIIASNLGY